MTFRFWDGNTVWSFIIVVFYLKMCSPLKHGKKGMHNVTCYAKKEKGQSQRPGNQYFSDEHCEPKLFWSCPFFTLFCQSLNTNAARANEMTTKRQLITRREYLSFVYTLYTHALPSTHSSQPSLQARHSKWCS